MDISALQSQITDQEAIVASATSALATEQAKLDTLNAEFAVASQVNALETLTEDQITAFNSLLAGDPSNTLNISIAVGTPSVAATHSAGASEEEAAQV